MRKARKQSFRRTHDFVAVKPIRISSTERLLPGEEIDKKIFRPFHLKSLYRRGLIAVKGSEWAEKNLERWAAKVAKSMDEGEIEYDHIGGGHYVITSNGAEIARVHGKKNLQQWLTDHGLEE